MLVIQTDKRKVADFQAASYTATSCHDLTLQAMQVQNHVWGPAIMTFATAAANIPINMILIKYYDFWGAALATSVARILLLLLLCGELPLHPPPPGHSRLLHTAHYLYSFYDPFASDTRSTSDTRSNA